MGADGYPVNVIRPDWEEETIPDVTEQNGTEVILWGVFASHRQIVYEDDFGDYSLHTITLCSVIEDIKKPYPHCILAEGDALVEDCGGPDEFENVMKALKDTVHPEHREIAEWVHSTWR